ncbi:MAG TPA: flagellar hook-associated protein FlgL, partial [Albitalea sp.]|nr:flagellar hook-associated protein FlgL [Albitalea sp.]
MTRIGTANTYDTTVDRLVKRQNELGEAQLQLTSGKRVNRPSDDPTAAGRAERALASTARIDAAQRGVDASRALMSQSESALGDAGELLQQAREALVAAGNGSYSDAERKIQADHLRGLRQQILAVANRSDGANGYLFAGQGSSQPPFLDAPGGVQYLGTSGEALVAGSETLPISIDGAASWLSARTGNGVFETRAVMSTGNAWIDAGSVSSPAALTGSTYDVQFSVAAGVTTYSVLKDGVATAQTNVAYSPGTAIQIDGMAVTISGAAANGDDFQL